MTITRKIFDINDVCDLVHESTELQVHCVCEDSRAELAMPLGTAKNVREYNDDKPVASYRGIWIFKRTPIDYISADGTGYITLHYTLLQKKLTRSPNKEREV